MEEKLPDQLNMDLMSSALKNLSAGTVYKKLQKQLEGTKNQFKGYIRPDVRERFKREIEYAEKERAKDIARLRAEEDECERLAWESDKAGNFKRYARFWNRLNAAREGLIRLGAVGP